MKPFATVRLSCGRFYLSVAGFALAMQGDKCRDGNLPEEVMPPIPEEELANAFIGDKPAKDLPVSLVRWFRGDCWTEKMLEHVAGEINKRIEAGTWPGDGADSRSQSGFWSRHSTGEEIQWLRNRGQPSASAADMKRGGWR